MMLSFDDLANQCRTHDYERYVCSLFAPKTYRPILWSMLALGHTWSRIPTEVHEPMIALVKLKWWQEQCHAVAHHHGTPPHAPPLLCAVAPLMQRSPALVMAMESMLEALADHSSEGATLEHVRSTMRAYYRMLAHAVDQPATEEAYGSIGDAYSIIASYRRSVRDEDGLAALDDACAAMVRPPDAFGSRLYRLNRLWQRRIHRATQQSSVEKMHMIPLLAVRLL
jgi:Squalene/phytoene synthase